MDKRGIIWCRLTPTTIGSKVVCFFVLAFLKENRINVYMDNLSQLHYTRKYAIPMTSRYFKFECKRKEMQLGIILAFVSFIIQSFEKRWKQHQPNNTSINMDYPIVI